MRTVRPRRTGFIDLRRITLGDYIVLASSILAVVSLFLPWLKTNSTLGSHSDSAFAYSEAASVVVILFFLATLFLVFYPAITDTRLPALPFAPPLFFATMGIVLLLIADFELGRYSCVLCTGISRGIGVYLAMISAVVYIVGAIILIGGRAGRR